MPDGTTVMYEHEMLSSLEFLIRQMGLTARLMTQIRQDPVASELGQAEEFNEKYLQYQKVSGNVTNAMINLIMNPGHRHPDLRAKLFVDCKRALIDLISVMTEKDRQDATFKLSTLRTFTTNEEEREAIATILGPQE